jgi:simple sugar transport system substrate-binding protein
MSINFKRSLRSRLRGRDVSQSAARVDRRRWRMLSSCALVSTACLAVMGLPASAPVSASTVRAQGSGPELIVNYEGGAEIPFYAIIEKGVNAAAKDLGVNAVFQAPPCPNGSCSVVAQAQLLDSEIAAHPAAIAVQFNNASLIPGIERAVNAGIKVFITNTQNLPEYHSPANINNMAFVGQNQYDTGTPIAQNLAPYLHSGDSVVCINPGPSQIAQTIRCSSVKSALAAYGVSAPVLVDTETGVAAQSEAIINGYLLAHPKTAGIVALGSNALQQVCQIKEQRHLTLAVAGYDLSSAVAACIQNGEINFTLDQEPWLQGYLTVVEMATWVKYGMLPANIDSGQIVVNKSNLSFFEGQLKDNIGG